MRVYIKCIMIEIPKVADPRCRAMGSWSEGGGPNRRLSVGTARGSEF